MRRICALVLPLCLIMASVSADDKKPTEPPKTETGGKLGKLKGKMDKSKFFEKLDTNGDGKVTKDEYKTFFENLREKAKDKGKGKLENLPEGLSEKMFDKLDADSDGAISKEEFEKFEGAKGGALKGKLTPEMLQKLKDRRGDSKAEEKKPEVITVMPRKVEVKKP
jgi:Ca2+-binding EF-hand superfamily protein